MYYMQHHDPGLLKISPCTCSRVVTRMFYMVTLHISLFVTYPILWMTGWSRWEFCKMFFSASFSLLSASYAPYNHMLYSTLNSFRSANLIKTTMKSKYFCSCNCMNTSLESLFILRYALLHVIWRMCTHVRRCLKIALGTFFYYPTSLIHEVCRKSAFVKTAFLLLFLHKNRKMYMYRTKFRWISGGNKKKNGEIILKNKNVSQNW